MLFLCDVNCVREGGGGGGEGGGDGGVEGRRGGRKSFALYIRRGYSHTYTNILPYF